ncbi:MAG: caspase family protein [Thermoplasmata archaeon]|nr:caspase family protein [Thermoplasmata archaeon]
MDGDDVASIAINAKDVLNKKWIYFDLSKSECNLRFDRQYYIIIKMYGEWGDDRHYYRIYYGDNDPYKRGSAYVYENGKWNELSQDLCFETYGEYNGNEPDGVEERYALVIGNAHYSSGTLVGPINDANQMATLLSESGWHVSLVINATRSDVLNAFEQIASKEDMDDIVLFYYSGHGGVLKDPPDYKPKYAAIHTVDGKNVGATDFEHYFGEVMYSQKQIFIFDSCNSGGFIEAPTNITRDGRIIIASSLMKEASYGSRKLNSGIFSYYFIQGLRGSADGIDGYSRNNEISAEEAFTYAAPRTTEYAIKPQHPEMYDGIEGEVMLTKV